MSAQAPARGQFDRWLTADVVLIFLAAVVLTGGASLWVSLQVPVGNRLLVGVFGGVLSVALCAALLVAVYNASRARVARQQARTLETEFSALADQVLPVAVRQLRDGASADTVIAEMTQRVNGLQRHVLSLVAREIGVGERRTAAVMAACASAAGRVQAMATSMLAELREMENRHSEEVLGDLLRIDHATAQAGRLADSIAVLTGARSGRRWGKPIVMESILRGAMGRIGAYQRVRVHSASTAAIAGYAAEDVMHALAELMDNATRFSAPSEEVHVYVEDLHTGVVVTIEDGGLGMKRQALERAEAAVSTAEPVDIAKLSGTRLGLAVVGTLARKHDLHVFFRPSSRGGTGVVLRIPNPLVVQPRWDATATEPQAPAREPAHVGAARVATANHNTGSANSNSTGSGGAAAVLTGERPMLPKRPRGQTLAASTRPAEPPLSPSETTSSRDTTDSRPRTDLGARFTAFHQGSRAGSPDEGGPAVPGEDETR